MPWKVNMPQMKWTRLQSALLHSRTIFGHNGNVFPRYLIFERLKCTQTKAKKRNKSTMSKVILITGKTVHQCHGFLEFSPTDVSFAGSNTGIGFELVRLLAEKKHTVYLSGRNETSVKEAL